MDDDEEQANGAAAERAMTLAERAERLSGAIYGTIVCAGVLAATAPSDQPDAAGTAVYMLATVVVFWLAHAWAHTLGRWAVGAAARLHALREALANDWPLVLSALPPLAAMGIVWLLGGDDGRAINVAIWLCAVELTLLGGTIARRGGAPPLGIAAAAVGCGALGALMVVLKLLVH